jgi:hypothetical protein
VALSWHKWFHADWLTAAATDQSFRRPIFTLAAKKVRDFFFEMKSFAVAKEKKVLRQRKIDSRVARGSRVNFKFDKSGKNGNNS